MQALNLWPTNPILMNLPWKHSFCCCSVTKLWSPLCSPGTEAHQAAPPFTVSQILLKFMLSQWRCLTILFSANPFNFSQDQGLFQWVSSLHQVGKILERPWCWERLKAGGEGDDRGWDGWMASPTRRREPVPLSPAVVSDSLRPHGLQYTRPHDLATDQKHSYIYAHIYIYIYIYI